MFSFWLVIYYLTFSCRLSPQPPVEVIRTDSRPVAGVI